MPTPPLSDAKALEALRALQEHGTATAAAAALGLPRGTFNHHISVGRDRGLHLDSGIQEALRTTGLSPGTATHGWRRVKDPETGSFNSVFWKAPPEDQEAYLDRVREKFENITPAPPIAAPTAVAEDRVNLLAACDWHFGSSVSEGKAGAVYNREIAIQRLRDGTAQSIAALPPAKTAIILWNGDTTHANDDKDATPRSGHKLKVEGSHFENIGLTIDAMAWQVDLALERHDEVEIAVKPGNHDPNTPAPILYAMQQRYRENPRVNVRVDEGDFYIFQRGKLFICAHHGDGQKPEKIALTIPYKFRKDWGESDHHYYFSSHLHHKRADTFGGLHWTQLPALGLLDQNGAQMGFAETGGMLSFSFDVNLGLRNEFTVSL